MAFKLVPPLSYLLPVRYELDEPFEGYSHVYGEVDIGIAVDKWKKFTNNDEYCGSNFYATLSHFSY